MGCQPVAPLTLLALCRELPEYAKAVYRRGATHAALHNVAEATADFELVKRLDPELTADMDRELRKLKQSQAAGTARQKQQLRSFLDRKPK